MDEYAGVSPSDPDDVEGMRIIGAQEAASADSGRLPERRNDPRTMGPPQARPASTERPLLRFPLAGSESLSDFARPRPLDGPTTQRMSADDPGEDAPEPAARPRSLFSIDPAVSGPSDADPVPPGKPVPDDGGPDDGGSDDRGSDDRGSDDGGSDESDVIDLDDGDVIDDTGEIRIPHWTEPATGEVPDVVRGDADEVSATWESFAGTAPRWRDEGRDFDDGDGVAALIDEAAKVGALDPDAPGDDELFSFDDIIDGPAPPEVTERSADPTPTPAPPTGEAVPTRAAAPGSAPVKKKKKVKKVSSAPPSKSGGSKPVPGGGGRGGGGGSRPTDGERDLPMAVAVGGLLGVLALGLLYLGPGFMMAMVTGVVFFAAAEYFTTIRRAGYQPAQLLGMAACVALPLAVFWKGTVAYPVVLGLTMAAALIWYLVGADSERPTMNIGVTLLGVMWIGFSASFAGLLLSVPGQGASLLLATLLVAIAYDVGGFFIGSQFGRAPLTDISPGKTVEGLFGGIVVGIVVSVVVVGLVGISPFGETATRAFALGLVVAAATATGDLCQSVIKRDLGVKDMSELLPGHGGVLDRMDGILFALPAAWYLALVLL